MESHDQAHAALTGTSFASVRLIVGPLTLAGLLAVGFGVVLAIAVISGIDYYRKFNRLVTARGALASCDTPDVKSVQPSPRRKQMGL